MSLCSATLKKNYFKNFKKYLRKHYKNTANITKILLRDILRILYCIPSLSKKRSDRYITKKKKKDLGNQNYY